VGCRKSEQMFPFFFFNTFGSGMDYFWDIRNEENKKQI
jgi:hypothetical protein